MTELTGTWSLVRLALRRDRVLLPVWIVAIVGLEAAVMGSFGGLYASAEDRTTAAAFSAVNVAARIFDGPASGTDVGAMAMVEAFLKVAIFAALMSGQAVIRHSRQEEETGRAELVESAVVGRHARLTAALVAAVGASVLLAPLIAVVLVLNGRPWGGALAAGAAVTGVGLFFAGAGAVAAQLSRTQRGAVGIVATTLGVAFLLRAVGDSFGRFEESGVRLISAWPSWLSPLGWGQRVRPFDQNNWTALIPFVVTFGVLVAVAFVLTSHRDVGAAMLPERPGAARGARSLLSPVGLAWRQQRWSLLSWLVATLVWSIPLGLLGENAAELAAANDSFTAVLDSVAPGASVTDLYFTFVLGFLGVMLAGFTLQTLLRMRAEEAAGRLEPILATGVSRASWLASHTAIAAGGTVALLAVGGAAGGVSYAMATGDSGYAWRVSLAALAQAPAALALGAFVVVAFAILPRWAGAVAWAALGFSLVVSQFGELMKLPQWVLNVSPFSHVPVVPARPWVYDGMASLIVAAVVLAALGFAGFRRRDLVIGA